MLSKRLDIISPSCTIGISTKVKNMRQSGIDVITLMFQEKQLIVE